MIVTVDTMACEAVVRPHQRIVLVIPQYDDTLFLQQTSDSAMMTPDGQLCIQLLYVLIDGGLIGSIC